jgi:hypothetical protein
MPEIEFTINPTTGELALHVRGIAGPACDNVAKLAKELLGEPGREQNTGEYYVRTRTLPQIRPKSEP